MNSSPPHQRESWLQELLQSFRVPAMHREGLPFLLVCFVFTIVLGIIWTPLLVAGLVVTILCYGFFRDPERVTFAREGDVIAPADGVVQSVEEVQAPQGIGLDGEQMVRIAVFMSPLNVHVNRIPIDGEVIGLKYRAGKNLRASLDKADEFNERQSIGLRANTGHLLAMTQIAGFFARRIVCDLELQEEVEVGKRYGIIRFGSRVDVYVPKDDTEICVEKGQKTISGETRLAKLDKKKPVTKQKNSKS